MTANYIGWMLSGIVLLLLVVAGAILHTPIRLLLAGTRTEGVVVGMDTTSRFSSGPGKGPMQSPVVEFVTVTGERIRAKGKSYSTSPSERVGDEVTVAYSASNPHNVQFLSMSEFPLVPAGMVLGFAAFIVLLWISGILVSGDEAMGDPLHILTTVIARFRLNPFRFPILFMLSVVIPLCGGAAYVLSRQTFDIRSNGITVTGHVVGWQSKSSHFNDNTTSNGIYPMVSYEDVSGATHTIRRSLAKPWSRLQTGDAVQVLYPVRHPNRGIVDTWDELYLSPVFFGFVTIAFLVLLRLVLSGMIRF
jgi:Protein of unknown function (DUF3592)